MQPGPSNNVRLYPKLFFAAFLAVGLWLALSTLPDAQRSVAAVFGFTVVLWATEALPTAVTALLSTCLLILLCGIDPKLAFGAYGNYIIHLFIGSFIIAKSIEITGLNKRLAWTILSKPWATRSPSGLILTMGGIVLLVSSFVSNTATTAMMIPIVLTLLKALNTDQPGVSYATGAMLMLTWSASVAVGTPVSTPPNMIGIGLVGEATGKAISFGQWTTFAAPISLIMLLLAWAIVGLLFRGGAPDTKAGREEAVRRCAELGAMTQGERNVLIAFGAAVGLWLSPDLAGWLLGPDHPTTIFCRERITSAVAALLAASTLFVMPDASSESGRTITWSQARTIDWGTILLFGGGIALGDAMFRSGLAKALGEAAVQATGANSLWGITFVMIVAAVGVSELASNTAAATTMVPVAIGLAQGAGVDPTIPAVATTIACSLGFMLPVSTAPNAIVYGSGLVPAKHMMRAGIIIDLVGIAVVFGVMRVLMPILGFG
ncbi:MAG: DASS family sodium-coupled anion symporter [Fimbriimonadaceae bacterium]|nr:DASS family sodium-coupled anion symporter [Fimbriimonadaceae bacterium]